MPRWEVTIEDDAGDVWEGSIEDETMEINRYVRIRLYTRAPQYRSGIVIMFQERDQSI